MNFVGNAIPMTSRAMTGVCEALEVGEPEIWAVLTVETSGFGFLKDRRPLILFERHVFSRLTGGEFDDIAPDISNRAPGGYMGRELEYPRLAKAMNLSQEEALKSASWGLAQVMGFNFQPVGYDSVDALVTAIVDDEDAHLEALGRFIKGNVKCRIGIQRQDWGTFAAAYNGPNFQINDYANRLAAAFAAHKQILPDIGYRSAQIALMYLGFDPGPVDGIRGRKTRGAISDFQLKTNIPATGELDENTSAALTARAFN